MENEKRNPLDELFRRKLNEEQLVPDDSLWMEIEDQLEKKTEPQVYAVVIAGLAFARR